MFDTPILLIVFNRPKTTQHLMDCMRLLKPKRLFIAADGPRLDNLEDKILCKQTRAVFEQIDWACDVKTLFKTENRGVGKGVSEGINWFFDHVEEGIILEDDCIPHPSFFPFCAIMLEKYRFEETVWQIAGTNYLFGKTPDFYEFPYFFSTYTTVWGWATWKRAWQYFDFVIPKDWQTTMLPILKVRFQNPEMENLLMHMYRQITEKQVDTWDIQWSYCVNRGGGLCVTPLQNLVRNTGIQGSHFSYRTPFHNMRIQPFPLHRLTDLPSNHPPLSIQHEIEAMAFNNILHRPLSLPLRILRKIEMLFR